MQNRLNKQHENKTKIFLFMNKLFQENQRLAPSDYWCNFQHKNRKHIITISS